MSNLRAIVLLLLGCALLAAAHVFLSFQGVGNALVQRSTLMGEKSLPPRRISVERRGAPPTVLEREDGWNIVSPYVAKADERKVLGLLDALFAGRITGSFTRQSLAEFERSTEDYGLDDPAVTVSVEDDDGSKKTARFGISTPKGDGVFALVDGDTSVYIVETNVMAAADMPADGFRQRDLCPAGLDAVDSFDLKRGKGLFMRFVRRNGVWTKSSAKDGGDEAPASAVKVRELLSGLAGAAAAEFIWPVGAEGEPAIATASLLAGYGLEPESAVTVTLRSHGRAEQQVAFGKDARDGLVYALVQNAGAVVTVDGSLKDIAEGADFTDSRLFPYESAKVSRISVVDDGVNYLLAKGDDGRWHMDAPVSVDADEASVAAFLSKLLSLDSASRSGTGVMISLTTNSPPETVSRAAALGGLQLEDLRSREILRFDPSEVHRLAVTGRGAAKPVAVVFDKDKRSWIVESSERSGTVMQSAVEGILSALNPLKAEKIVKLKVSPNDLRRYGLETPRCTVAVDSSKDGALRRNILIGEKSQGGSFATLGASDAVFVLPDEVVNRLLAPIVTE